MQMKKLRIIFNMNQSVLSPKLDTYFSTLLETKNTAYSFSPPFPG